MRIHVMIAMLGACFVLCSPASQAQTPRPLTVWIDTTTLNVCDSGTFFLRVWAGTPTDTGMRIGFSVADSLYLFRLALWWDRSKFDIDPVLQLPGSGVPSYLASRAKERPVTKDPDQGILYLEAGNPDLKPLVGENIPLVVFRAKVTAPGTFDGVDGWAEVRPLEEMFEGARPYGPITYNLGFVHVVRDTTPEYTGRLNVSAGAFDTLRADTIAVNTDNLGNRGVTEITFSLKADTAYYVFTDTLRGGTLAEDAGWTTTDVFLSRDSIAGRFVGTEPLTTDGPLLKVILGRMTDSAFSSSLKIPMFEINQESCLGKLQRMEGAVEGRRIVKEVDTTPTSAYEPILDRTEKIKVIPMVSDGSVLVVTDGFEVERIDLYDETGQLLWTQRSRSVGMSSVRITPTEELSSGTYFVVIHGRKEVVHKQFTFIK